MNQIKIQNLKCGGCAKTITNNLNEIKGVSNIEVNVEESIVYFDANAETVELVKETLKKLGYPEEGDANNLGAKTKSYVSCAIGKMS